MNAMTLGHHRIGLVVMTLTLLLNGCVDHDHSNDDSSCGEVNPLDPGGDSSPAVQSGSCDSSFTEATRDDGPDGLLTDPAEEWDNSFFQVDGTPSFPVDEQGDPTGQDGDEVDPESEISRGSLQIDCFRTETAVLDFHENPIPAGFFGPGSQPFTGMVPLEGIPLGIRGAFDLGNADILLGRRGPESLPADGESLAIPTELVELSLRSAAPIVIEQETGPMEWVLRVTLTRQSDQPEAISTIEATAEDGGTLDLSVAVLLRLEFFGPDREPRTIDLGASINRLATQDDQQPLISLHSTQKITWLAGSCPHPFVSLPGVSEDLCLGAEGETAQWTLEGSGMTITMTRARSMDMGYSAEIDETAQVDDSAILGAGVVVGPGAVVGAGAVIGPDVMIGTDVVIGDLVIVGHGARILDGSSVGTGSYIGEMVTIGEYTHIGSSSVVHASTLVGPETQVGDAVYLGAHSYIGAGVTIGHAVHAAGPVYLGDGASLLDGLYLAPWAEVAEGETSSVDLRTCLIPSEAPAEIPHVLTVETCTELMGAVGECVPPLFQGLPAPGRRIVPGQVTGRDRTELDGHVDGAGVSEKVYVDDDYDCDDFAGDLEKYLQEKGYDATFTCYWRLNPDWAWYNALWTPRWIDGHCLTDIHLADGSYVWIEPQWNSGEGAVGQDLDFDGDGRVGVAHENGSSVTEGDYRIEVYGSRAEAEAAGVDLD